jgi:predicted ATPase
MRGGAFLRRIVLLPDETRPDAHPFDIPAFRAGIDLALRTGVTFFVGENGSGKSTLLEAVAKCCGFNPEGGGRDHHFKTRDDAVDLASALRLSWLPKVTDGFFMRAESFYNFATYLDEVSCSTTRPSPATIRAWAFGPSPRMALRRRGRTVSQRHPWRFRQQWRPLPWPSWARW